MLEVCKHNQSGYCKNGLLCQLDHVSEICQIAICRDPNCRKRHPKTCRYFARYNTCKRLNYCAYAHPDIKSISELEIMKKEVKSLKLEVEELKKNNAEITKSLNEMQREEIIELRQNVDQLSMNMSEMMIKIVNIETEENDQSVKKSPTIKAKYPYFKCDVCSDKFNSQIKLKKHNNMKHPIKMPQTKQEKSQYQASDSTLSGLECSTCEDKFTTNEELQTHIKEHLDEIVNLNIEYLKSGHESFVCNKCQWNSNNVKQIKDHLSNHVATENEHANLIDKLDDDETSMTTKNDTKKTENDNKEKKFNWRDNYDEHGDYIGPESSDDEDTEDDEE